MAFNPGNFSNVSNISQQVESGISSVAGSAGNSLSGLQSSASSLVGSVSDIGNKLLSSGQSLLTSGMKALEQLGSFTTVSKFAENLKPPSPIIDAKPEASRGKFTIPTSALVYPKDIGPYCISFEFQQNFKSNALAPRTVSPSRLIYLPMPSDLVDKFNAQYSSKDLGILGKIAEMSGVMSDIQNNTLEAKSAGEKLGRQVTPQNALAALRSAIGDTGVGAAIDRATGTTMNPFTALQFQSVGLRKHSFKFKFSPNSRDEALVLQEIIRTFKERMLPEKSGLLFLFPDTCVIKFIQPNMPYSFKTCFLESLSVNYAPSGTPSFFKGGEFASEVEIQLEFGEIEPVTREDITKAGGDITGSGQAYEAYSTGEPSPDTVDASPGVKKYMRYNPQTKQYENVLGNK